MDITTLLRRVKREYGDEYGLTINDNDIYDWVNEGQSNIIRNTTSNDITVTTVANQFPIEYTDRIMIKRVAINNKALTYTSLQELDISDITTTQEGTPLYWYYSGGEVHLWPTPAASDTYNIFITYAKTPTPLTLVAPYLEWSFNQAGSQYLSFTADTDFNTSNLYFDFEVTFKNPGANFTVVGKGSSSSVAANLTYVLYYLGATANGRFQFKYSNGTTIRTADLDAPTVVTGQKQRYRIKYIAATGLTELYTISSAGAATLVDSDDQADSFNISATSFDLVIGALSAGAEYTNEEFLLHYFKLLKDTGATNQVVLEFVGSEDLTVLPVVPATPFAIKSGQQATAVGNIQVYSPDNVFSIPEVWHDDLVRFCLARAHLKNRNNRGYETAMEEFNQKVTMQRHESASADTPAYKSADPFDYGWDWDATYG